MRLFGLPKELLIVISQYLSRKDFAYLCLSCKGGYQIFLSLLYKHVKLGHRTQMKQLEQGLQQNEYLKKTMKESTEKITLRFRQGGNESFWKTLFENAPNTRALYLRDYPSLSIKKLHQALRAIPKVSIVNIEYCGLVQKGEKVVFDHVKRLHLMWTDFTTEASQGLFGSFPDLEEVTLGANHNRRRMDNDIALQTLKSSCKNLRKLSISLQQIRESTLCNLLVFYGPNLEYLSIRCEGQKAMKLIAQYAKKLQHLIIRHSASDKDDITHVLQGCKSLTHFEMVSWPVRDVPSIVLEHAQQSPLEDIRKTFALDTNDLKKIRHLGLYPKP